MPSYILECLADMATGYMALWALEQHVAWQMKWSVVVTPWTVTDYCSTCYYKKKQHFSFKMNLIFLLIPFYLEIQLIGYSQSIKLHLRRNLMEDLALISFKEFPFHSKEASSIFPHLNQNSKEAGMILYSHLIPFKSWKRFSFLRQTMLRKL